MPRQTPFFAPLRRATATIFTLATSIWAAPAYSASWYWDADETAVGNQLPGVQLGGTGTWNLSNLNWWDGAGAADAAWPNTAQDIAVFAGTGGTVTLGASPVTAGGLQFDQVNVTIQGGSLVLAGASTLDTSLGSFATIDSLLGGNTGLIKSGRGTVLLTNPLNSFTGLTTVNNGTLAITSLGALGASTSGPVVVTGSNTIAAPGGNLMLISGWGSTMEFGRPLSITGAGTNNVGSAFTTLGDVHLTGALQASSGGTVDTRLTANYGTLEISGLLTLSQTTARTVYIQGAGNVIVDGVVTGIGNILKAGPSSGQIGGMELTNPNNDFSGTVRIDNGSLRVANGAVLGTNATNAAITIGGSTGIIEFRTDAPNSFGTRRITMSTGGTGTLVADHAVISSALNETILFPALTLTASTTTRTLTLNSRNGYGFTFSGDSVGGGLGGNNTIAVNANGPVTFDGDFWNNTSTTQRTLTMTINTGAQATISGSVIASGASHILTKSGAGTLTILGNDSTYLDATNVSAGTLAISSFGSINNNTAALTIGATTTAATLNVIGADLTPALATTSKAINLAGTTGGATILANQTGASSPLLIQSNLTAGGAGAKVLTLGGANALDNEIGGIIPNNSGVNTTALTKIGGGTWVLSGVNTYTGTTTITNGLLKIKANAATSTIIDNTSGLTFNVEAATQSAGGTLEIVGQDGAANVETLGALTPTAGMATLKLTPGAGGSASLVFGSYVGAAAGAGFGVNIVGSDASSTVTLTGVATGLASPNIYFGGSNFAYSNGGVLRAPVYGTDAGFTTSATALTATSNNEITGSFSIASITINSLKTSGSNTLTLNSSQTLTVRSGAAGTPGGILATGGSSTITGGTGITTGGTGALVVRVDGSTDVLTIASVLTSGTTGGLTKNGEGTLVLSGVNAQTGTTNLNEGTIKLSGSGRLSANSTPFVIRQGAVLDLNGVSTTTSATAASINSFNGAGTITNTSATAVVFGVGSGTTTGTGTFTGSIDETAGKISVVKQGTSNSQTWTGISNYTGSTTIGVPGTGTSGVLTVSYLADIGQPSTIGRGDATDAASNAASLVFGGTTGGLTYAGNSSLSIDRLFTLAGTAAGAGAGIGASGVNNATVIWRNTAPIVFAAGNTAAQTLTLTGTSLGDNEFDLQIIDNPNAAPGAAPTAVTKAAAGFWILGNESNNYTGATTITAGTLRANDGGSLPTTSALILNGGSLEASGTFTRDLAATATPGAVTWTAGGGFGASTGRLVVAIGGTVSPTPLTWGANGFVPSGNLLLETTTSLYDVEMVNDIDLNGAVRTVQVNDNTNTAFDFATLSGVISGTGASGLTKTGNGPLQLLGANTYEGNTSINQGALVVTSVGGSASLSSNLGASTGALNVGSSSTTGTLLYVGPGEDSDRQINLAGTTGGFVLDASGSGPLRLSRMSNTGSGAKTLTLQGQNTDANEITANLANNGGNLTISKAGGGTWILSGDNSGMSGSVTAAGGALGLGNDNALGTGTLVLSNASIFAYGGDRTIANAVTHNNNTVSGFIGDYSLNFTGNLALGSSSSNPSTTTNNIADDKTLSFNTVTANSISAARTWTINGSGNTILNGDITTTTAFALNVSYTGNGTLTLNGANLTGGTTTISNAAAQVYIANDGVFGTGPLALTSGTLFSSGGDRIIANNVTHGGTFIIGGSDHFTFNGTWLNSAASRTLTVNTSGGIELAGQVNLSESATTARTLTINGTGDVLISGVISNGVGTGASALSYTGSGTLTITGANTFTGATTLNNAAGTMRLTGNGELGAGNLTVSAGSLVIESVNQSVATLTMGNVASASATLDVATGLTLTPTAITYSGTTALPATITGNGTLALGASGLTVTVSDNISQAADMVWDIATLTGSGTLIKAGAGNLDISGLTTNSFDGVYQINAGAILGLGALDNNIALNGGVYADSGAFTRSLGTADNQIQWLSGGGGFAAVGGDLTVTMAGAPDPLVWGGTANFVPDGAPLIFGMTAATGVTDFTHNVDLNGADRTVNAIDNTTQSTDKAVLSGVLSNGSLTKTGNGVVELRGANTFSGSVTVSTGTLQFSTVNNNGGGPSNLGQGTDGIILNGGILSFIGDGAANSQTTNRGITGTATNSNLAANGTNGATITYAGPIDLTGFPASASLFLTGTGAGFITGGISMTGGSADIQPQSGNWTLSGTPSALTDDFINTGASVVVNLNSTGVLTWGAGASTSPNFYIRGGATVNLGADDAITFLAAGQLLLGDLSGTAAVNTLNMNGYNLTVPSTLSLGATGDVYEGVITGTGTLTVGTTIATNRGSISANLAGAGAVQKLGMGTVTFSGDNSGLTGITAVRVDAGELILDYTGNNAVKLREATGLDMRGGALTLTGNGSADTTQTVASLTLASGGSNTVSLNNGSGHSVTLNLGAMTRANGAGTLRVDLPSSGAVTTTTTNHATTGMLGAAGTAFATVTDATGTYFAINDGSNNIAPLTYVGASNDVTAWASGSNITDGTTGFTGTRGTIGINSLRFDAATGAPLTLASDAVLTIASGGVLRTANAAGVASGISGGTLTSGFGELVFTIDGAGETFTVSSDIRSSTILTKTGAGTMRLSGTNYYGGATILQNGILELAGGNAIGDRSAVTLADDHTNSLILLADETFGNLAGGSSTTGLHTLAVVDMGLHNLTLNQYSSATYSGLLDGSGVLTKVGNGTLSLGGASTDFTGDLIVNQGQVTLLTRTIANLSSVSSVTLNSATLLLDFTGGTETAPNKINNSAPITMINTGGIDGLRANNDRNDASKAETVGVITFLGGANTITPSASSTSGTTQRNMTITAASVVRSNQATLLVRGQNLGTTLTGAPLSPIHTGRFVNTTLPAMIGGGGAAGTTTINILPWAIGSNSITGVGESFVTAVATTGYRPLDVLTEYEQLAANGGVTAANNVRYSDNVDLVLDNTAKTMNSLLVDNTSTTGAISLTGSGSNLQVNSGAFLFTGTQGITIDGFSGITTGSNGTLKEFIFHVSNSSTAGVTLASPLVSPGAVMTKSGPGVLILAATGSTYAGQTAINQGVLQIDSLNKLGSNGSGGLLLNGGTLRFGGLFDPSAITVTFGVANTETVQTTAGGTLDTNGYDITFAHSVGNGGNGGMTKAGLGTLTLGAPATYTGVTTVSAGTLAYGVANALPANADLTIAGGSVDFGGYASTIDDLTLTGNGTLTLTNSLTVTGGITNYGGSRTLTFDGVGTTTFDGNLLYLSESASSRTLTLAINAGAVVINNSIVNGASSASALTKTGAGSLELTAANYYSGTTTIGSSSLPGGTVLLTGSGTLGTGNLTMTSGLLSIGSVDQSVATLTMGGGPAGSSAEIDIGAGLTLRASAITFSATNNNQTSVIGGAGTLDLGTAGITVNIGNSTAVDVDMSWEMDTVIGSGAFIKTGTGTLDIRGVTHFNYNASSYQVNAGAILGLDELGVNLVLNGGTFEGNGTFDRALGTGPNQVQWFNGTGGGGFSAAGGDLLVAMAGTPDPLVWGGTPYFVPSGAPLIFGSTTADGVVEFSHNLDLNGAIRTISAIDDPLVTTDWAVLSGVLSNGGLTKSGNGILLLTGNNTFADLVTVTAGTLQFSTVTDSGGAASNLGQGTAISLGGGILQFVGAANQSTNRPVTQTASGSGLSAAGTAGATITYTGAISTAGNTFSLTGNATSAGFITGGITQTGTAADVDVNSGTWNLGGTLSTVADDIHVTNTGSVLNLTTTGSITFTTGTSNFIYARNGGQVNFLADDVTSTALGFEGLLAGFETPGAIGVINMNSFNLTTPRIDIGNLGAGLEGLLTGTGTITVGTSLNYYRGTIEGVTLTGAANAVKNGQGEMILKSNNTGLTGTTTVTNGILRLNYADSNTRKIGSGALTMNGGQLIMDGNASAGTVETVAGVTVNGTGSAGSSTISVNNGAGQTATLNLGGITRSATGGTVNFTRSSASAVITTTAANPASMTSLGGWAIFNGTTFATVSAGNIEGIAAAAKDDVSTWAAGDNVTDLTGYTGVRGSGSVNSIVFDAAAGSTLQLAGNNRFFVSAGGVLVTANAGAGGIEGGVLASGLPVGGSTVLTELIIHQYSSDIFTLTSTMNGLLGLTKSGPGILLVDGVNGYSGQTSVNEGIVRLSGGKAIGDRSLVNLKNNPGVFLELNGSSETFSGLVGGGTDGGTMDIGSGTLSLINNTGSATFVGFLKGDGTLIKGGTQGQVLQGTSTDFTGNVIVNGSLLQIEGASGRLPGASGFTVSGTGELLSDQDQSSSIDRIGNVQVTLNNANGGRGFWLRNESQDGTRTEAVGTVLLGAGSSIIQATTNGGTNTARIGSLTLTSLTRDNHATLLVRGQSLGAGGTIARGRIVPAVAPAGVTGGGGAAGSTTISIVPYVIGQTVASDGTNGTDAIIAGFTGNSFVTWVNNTEGLRPLNVDTEYVLNEAGYNGLGASTTSNVRFAANPAAALTGSNKTINSLVLDSSAAALVVSGPSGANLTLNSGALLAATTTPANGITINGYSEIKAGGAEYLIYVTNPTNTLTIESALTSQSALVKSGAGILALSGANTYNGGTWFNQGLIEVSNLGALGSGDLNFFGGGLRWATGAAYDPTTLLMTFGSGGAIFDTNSNDVTFANAFGNGGMGGLAKIGAGNLTLSAVGDFGGGVAVNAGTLTFGIAAALPASTDLSLGGGTLDVGAFPATLRGLDVAINSTIAGSADLTFTGNATINGGASRTLTVNNTGTTTLDGDYLVLINTGNTARTLTISAGTGALVVVNSAVVDGASSVSGSITKSGAGTLVLNGLNSYTGTTTVSAGSLGLGNDGALGFGTLVVNSATVFAQGGDRTIGNLVQQGNSATSVFNGANSLTFANTYALLASSGSVVTTNDISSPGVLNIGSVTANAMTAARTWTINGGGETHVTGDITTTTSFNLNLVYSGTGTIIFSGAKTYLGTTSIGSATVSAGTFRVESGSNISNAATTVSSGILDLLNSAQSITSLTMGGGPAASTATVRLNGGALSLGGNVAYNGQTNGAATASIEGGTLNLTGTRTFTVNDSTATSTDMTVSAVIANGDATARGLTKAGTGTLLLSAANTYTGTTTVSANGGILSISNGSALGGAAGGTVVNDGGSLELQNDITVGAESLSIAGIGSNGLGALRNLSGANTYGGLITLTAAAMIQSDAGTLNLDVASGNAITGTFDLTFAGAGNVVVSDPVNISTAALLKEGTGILTLGAASTYSGLTLINDGVVLANNAAGSATGSNTVMVAASGTLGGTGSVAGNVDLAGVIAPGGMDSLGNGLAGQLTVASLSITSGGALHIQIGGATAQDPENVGLLQNDPGSFVVPSTWTDYQTTTTQHDQLYLSAAGAPALDGLTISVDSAYLNGYMPAYGDVFQIMDWASLGTNNATGTVTFDLPTLSGFTWDTSLFYSHGIVALVPEPSRGLLVMLALAALTHRRRRR